MIQSHHLTGERILPGDAIQGRKPGRALLANAAAQVDVRSAPPPLRSRWRKRARRSTRRRRIATARFLGLRSSPPEKAADREGRFGTGMSAPGSRKTPARLRPRSPEGSRASPLREGPRSNPEGGSPSTGRGSTGRARCPGSRSSASRTPCSSNRAKSPCGGEARRPRPPSSRAACPSRAPRRCERIARGPGPAAPSRGCKGLKAQTTSGQPRAPM